MDNVIVAKLGENQMDDSGEQFPQRSDSIIETQTITLHPISVLQELG